MFDDSMWGQMKVFKRLVFIFLALHALVDLTVAVIMYRRVGILAPSLGIVALCCVFSFYLFPALRDEEFSRRWFPGKFYRGPIGGPAAFWFTFAALALIHLLLTGVWVRVVRWHPNISLRVITLRRLIKASVTVLMLVPFLNYPFAYAVPQSKQKPPTQVTPAGQKLTEFLRAYNTGDLNVLRKFIAEHFDKTALEKRSADERASAGVATFDITRRLRLHSVARSTAYEVEALCQSEVTEAWFTITVQVAPQSPHRIVRQAFGFAARPADAIRHKKLTQTQIVKELKIYLAKLVAADMLSGAVLVARGGKVIFGGAYGSNASKKPNRIDTKFDLASMSKMFTSVAIAQLAEQGRLSYGDPIGKFLPDYPNKKAAEKVTLHHLLTHTSGVVDFIDKKEYQAARHGGGGRFQTMKDWFPFFAGDQLSFEPGEKNDYSNSNFIVLGAIIEKLTGQSYFDYARERIFRPAGMNHTAFTAARGNSAGGGLSTVGDLLKFDVALRSHRLLDANHTNLILTPKVNTGEGEAYGYGFEIYQAKGKRIVGHGGGAADADNRLDMYLDDGYTVVTLAKPHAAKNITRKLRELIAQGN